MIVVLSEADAAPPTSINGRELRSLTEAARLLGCRIVAIPPDVNDPEGAAAALAYAPLADPPAPAVWVGFIPSVARYAAFYVAALARGLRLLNTPTGCSASILHRDVVEHAGATLDNICASCARERLALNPRHGHTHQPSTIWPARRRLCHACDAKLRADAPVAA